MLRDILSPNPRFATDALRFAARELDEAAGLYYVRARWYDPVLGRFISDDPIGLAGGINNYAYALNDPVNLSDPSGLEPVRLVHRIRSSREIFSRAFRGAGRRLGVPSVKISVCPWKRRASELRPLMSCRHTPAGTDGVAPDGIPSYPLLLRVAVR